MDLQLSDKTAVVTGGSKGIGLAVVELLLAEGMQVVTGSRTITPELEHTQAVHVSVDLTTAEGESPARRARLEELDAFHAWWQSRMHGLWEEWQQYKRTTWETNRDD